MRMSDMVKLKDPKITSQSKFNYVSMGKTERGIGPGMRQFLSKNTLSKEPARTDTDLLYNKSLESVRLIFKRACIDFSVLPGPGFVDTLVKNIICQLQLNSVEIMDMFIQSDNNDYPCSHSVNVTFLSVMIGVWLNYNMSELNDLAVAAVFHDIGMLKFESIFSQASKLNKIEREQVNFHPGLSCEYVRQMPGITERTIQTIMNHHKRLKSPIDSLGEHPQIIGLADTLEAMTHPRPYKSSLNPHTAIKKIIEEMKDSFHQSIIKILVDNIGIYPIGTWVWMDTNEIALVVDTNPGSPLSPKVNIMLNGNIELLPRPRSVDLSKQTNINITGPLGDDQKLSVKKVINPKA